jgi:hypothetical protein
VNLGRPFSGRRKKRIGPKVRGNRAKEFASENDGREAFLTESKRGDGSPNAASDELQPSASINALSQLSRVFEAVAFYPARQSGMRLFDFG